MSVDRLWQGDRPRKVNVPRYSRNRDAIDWKAVRANVRVSRKVQGQIRRGQQR